MQLTQSIPAFFPSAACALESPLRFPVPVWLLAGYLFLITAIGKGPTYLGIPPVYLGEIVMTVIVVWAVDHYGFTKVVLADRGTLTAAILIFMCLGAAITSGGVGDWGLNALRDAALWYYGAFYFVGFCLGRDETLGPRLWRVFCVIWAAAVVWGTADQTSQALFGLALNSLGPVSGRGDPFLFNSTYEMTQQMVLGALIVLHGNLHRGVLGRFRAPLVAIAFLALLHAATSRGRGVKVGLAMSLLLLLVMNLAPGRRLQLARSVAIVLVFALVFGLGAFAIFQDDFLAVTNLDRFLDANPSSASGTAAWRLVWWKILWREVLDIDPWFGLGFGQSLSIYNPYLEGDANTAWPVRSPHNFNITVFTRMGFVGAAVWLSILALGIGGLFRRVWNGRGPGGLFDAARREQLAFWIVALIATWGNGTFGVLMEGPVLGIWFWFALGFAWGASCRGPDRVPSMCFPQRRYELTEVSA